MNKTTRLISFPLFVAAFFLCMSTICFGQALDVKEHTEKFQKKWLEYLHALGNVEGSTYTKYIRNGQSENEFTSYLIYSYPPLLVDLSGLFEAPTRVAATNEKYRFAVKRQSPADEWIPDMACGVDFPDKDVPMPGVPWDFPGLFEDPPSHIINPEGYRIFISIGVGLFGERPVPSLPYMIASEWVTIHELSLVEKNNEKQLYLSFEYNRENYILKGKVFLTTDFFLVTEGEFRIESGDGTEDVLVKIDYDTNSYKVPLPKNYYKKNTYSFDALKEGMLSRGLPYKGIHETIRRFDLKETDTKSFERFTLPALGFPEPVFDEP